MLELNGVSAGYGRATVLHEASLCLAKGEIVALIGANGAGKSTLVKAISGLLAVQGGRITLDQARLDGLSPSERVRRGIAHVPEGRQVFGAMSVEENLMMGAFSQRRQLAQAELRRRLDDVFGIFPVLRQRLASPASNLSGGQQQMLAIARGLMSAPQILLLDEPSLGLSPAIVAEVFELIQRLRARGLGILLSEQNAQQSLAIADRGYVLEMGRVAMHGPAAELLHSPEIAEKYLGVGSAVGQGRSDRLSAEFREVLSA